MSELWSWARCEETLGRLFERLDWHALGKLYVRDSGEDRWAVMGPRALTLGLDWARALLKRLPHEGASLHVGAGIAELPVLFAERFVRGRRVVAVNARLRECEIVAEGIKRVGLTGELTLRHGDAAEVAKNGGFDHIGCVSVFTDPLTWPQLSGVTYGRIPPPALDIEAFTVERERARTLAAALFAGLKRPGWITTTVEEVAWFAEQAGRAGVSFAPEDATLPTAVVGDPIGFVKVG